MRTEYQQKITKLLAIAASFYPKLPYHNFNHAIEVWSVAKKYGILSQLRDEERLVLESAAIMHDIVYVVGQKDNEEKSAELGNKLSVKLGYSNSQIHGVKELILATKWPTNPKNQLEKIICDADLDNLGSKDFFEKSRYLLEEWGVKEDINWYSQQLKLLENNHYYTNLAKQIRGSGKLENTSKVKEILKLYKSKGGEIKCLMKKKNVILKELLRRGKR